METMKKIALTVAAPGLDVDVEQRFGRSAFLLLVDPDTLEWDSIANPGRDAGSGAGIKIAQVLSERKVSDVISGEFGPKAHDALKAAGIAMHRCKSDTTVRKALDLLVAGKLNGLASVFRRGRGKGDGRGGGRRGRGR